MEPSTSPCSWPTVIAKKKYVRVPFGVNFRKLKSLPEDTVQLIPRTSGSFKDFGDTQVFRNLDLRNEY